MHMPDSNDDEELNKLLTELEKDTSEESTPSKTEEIKDKQASETLNKIKYQKPDWADNTNDDMNTYEYIEKEVVDSEW